MNYVNGKSRTFSTVIPPINKTLTNGKIDDS